MRPKKEQPFAPSTGSEPGSPRSSRGEAQAPKTDTSPAERLRPRCGGHGEMCRLPNPTACICVDPEGGASSRLRIGRVAETSATLRARGRDAAAFAARKITVQRTNQKKPNHGGASDPQLFERRTCLSNARGSAARTRTSSVRRPATVPAALSAASAC